MYEQHQLEQYFFDAPTLAHLAEFVLQFERPCCLCAPLLGQEIERRGGVVATLDIDHRFASLNGFRAYDIYRPSWLGEKYDLILCDPPFFRISLSQLFKAVRMLSLHDDSQPLLICYLARRSVNILGTFSRFGLEATSYYPAYQTVQKVERNAVEMFGNLGPERHQQLAGGGQDL